MKKMNLLLGVLTAMLLSACASEAPRPTTTNTSAIAVTVSLKPPLVGFLRQRPDVVYFVKLDSTASNAQVFPSNYNDGNDFYLLNAEPGRYVAVAAIYSKQGQTTSSSMGAGSGTLTLSVNSNFSYTTFFEEPLINTMETNVAAGEMAYLGGYVIAMNAGMDEASSVQKHYAGLVDARKSTNQYRGKSDESKTSNTDKRIFLEKAKTELQKSGWDIYAMRGLARLK